MRISDWSSDVCSSDLFTAMTKGRLGSARPLSMSFRCLSFLVFKTEVQRKSIASIGTIQADPSACSCHSLGKPPLSGLPGCAVTARSEEHTSELQSLMRSSYAVFCLKKKNNT